MSKPNPEPESTLPTKAEVLAFMAGEEEAMRSGKIQTGKISKRDIARAFNIKGDARMGLKRMLRELEASGTIERRGKTINKKGTLPTMIVVEITARDRDGELIARPTDWDASEQGAMPRILIHTSRDRRGAGAAPGIGDRALVRIDTARGEDAGTPRYTGRVVKLLAKPRPRMLGVLRLEPGESARVVPPKSVMPRPSSRCRKKRSAGRRTASSSPSSR